MFVTQIFRCQRVAKATTISAVYTPRICTPQNLPKLILGDIVTAVFLIAVCVVVAFEKPF